MLYVHMYEARASTLIAHITHKKKTTEETKTSYEYYVINYYVLVL